MAARAFPGPWEKGQLQGPGRGRHPMGFKRPQGAVGMQGRLSPLTMRLPVLLAALVAVATCTETFFG